MRRLVILLAIAATAFGGGAVAPAPHTVALAPDAYAKPCNGGYKHAVLPWGHKCLRRGQYCKLSGDRHYHRYGYHCHASSRDSDGDYHLK
jgi:hypothetical protein